MGFFDKLLEVINNGTKNTELFSDETEKTYYEIAYAVLSLFEEVNFDAIKKYVEYRTEQTCDEAKLQKALLNFIVVTDGTSFRKHYSEGGLREKKSAQKGFTAQKIEQLIEINRALDDSNTYKASQEDIFNICYSDTLPEIKFEFEKVIEVSKLHGIKHFKEGINRILDKYQGVIGKYVLAEMIRFLTRGKFMDGDPTVESVVLGYLEVSLCNEKTSYSKPFRVALVALKALHFEAFGETEDGYSTISEEICRNFVLNNDAFKSEIDKHPYDTDKYTNDFVNSIIKGDLFNSLTVYDRYWMPLQNKDPYYADMVCNRLWSSVAEKYENGESTDQNDAYNIILDYVNN